MPQGTYERLLGTLSGDVCTSDSFPTTPSTSSRPYARSKYILGHSNTVREGETPRRAKLSQKATSLLRLWTIYMTAAWRRGRVSRSRELSPEDVSWASVICFKCVLRRGKDLIVLLQVHFKEGKEDKKIANVCRFWSIRQALSKLQIDAEQSAISFRQEDRRRGRRAETVDRKSVTRLTSDMWYRENNVAKDD